MDLLQRILECHEQEINSIMEEAIKSANKQAIPVEKLGFLDYGKANPVFKGFIPLKTRIKYGNINIEDYGMETTDFFYEFAHFIKKYQIKNKGALIYSLESFINQYFGYVGTVDRETIFNDSAWNSTTTDEEYFHALANNKLGDLKGKSAAQCTERSALAQQILSIFGIETYYCMGCVDLDEKQEGHCFNIVKRKNDYALLDYSIPTTAFKMDGSIKAFYPFVGTISSEEFIDFIQNGVVKSFDDFFINEKETQKTNTQRLYVVGQYVIEKDVFLKNGK